jgi:hypothetical protein
MMTTDRKVNIIVIRDDNRNVRYQNISFWRVERDGSLTVFRESENGKSRASHGFAPGCWLEVHEEE